MRANLVDFAQHTSADEFKATTLAKMGELSHERVTGSKILLSIYVEPEITKGGIIRPPKNVDEARFQGKVGLILKKGPTAFKFDGPYRWGVWTDEDGVEHREPEPQIGDWVVIRASDGWDLDIKGVACRMIEAELVKMIITDPTLIY